jgi:hypothetical protein
MELCLMTQPLPVVKLFGVEIVGVNHFWVVERNINKIINCRLEEKKLTLNCY